jgi:predicted NAD-dependent protein-ADP-ribosyltransferase YbiA (DUF1768 family)
MTFNPENDGIDHLNVYSQGKTKLGVFASNFAPTPIQTEEGLFGSIESYWYWLQTSAPDRDLLCTAAGARAKKIGRAMRKEFPAPPDERFQEKIKQAITDKFEGWPDMLKLLRENTLPLVHYYVMYGRVIEAKGNEWVLEHLQDLAKSEELI